MLSPFSIGNFALGTTSGLLQKGLSTIQEATGNLKAAKEPSDAQLEKAQQAAQEFEGVFLNVMFQEMFKGLDGDGPLGAAGKNEVWRNMLTDEYSQSISQNGGIGLSDDIFRQLLEIQEQEQT